MANLKSYPNNADVYIGAEEVMRWHHGRTSGVYGADGNLAVEALTSPAMAVSVTDGEAWMSNGSGNGVAVWNDNFSVSGSLLELNIDAADGVLNRIDRIIIEWKTTNYIDYPEIKVLKGTPNSNPSAPALVSNSTKRQISLAQIAVAAGTTAITSSMITDERLDPSVCGIVTETITADTSTMNAQFQAFLEAIQRELADIEAGAGVELRKLQFSNVAVPTSAFVSDSTYEDYPYRASVALSGVISTMIPEVVFALPEAVSGNFAPIADTYMGGIYLYAQSVPEAEITIPTILCWKGNGLA